ncbi:MAG: nucleotide exchange factor GrpE [Nocardioidaceae bacterium]
MTFDPEEFGSEGPVVRDKRRIDPTTGKLREPQDTAAPGATRPAPTPAGSAGSAGSTGSADTGHDASSSDAEVALKERTADLQRLQAEYVNYKRRVDRDRDVVRSSVVASTLAALLPVLDDIGRARDHGELTGGFKAVAESLERIVTGLGLTAFGEAGDDFDPRIQEALMHTYSDEVDRPVCQAILQVGYRYGDRIVRPARVAVAEPELSTGQVFASPAEVEAVAEVDQVHDLDEVDGSYDESASGAADAPYDQDTSVHGG